MFKVVFIDIDNTLLSFDGYVQETMKTGFAHFGLKAYEPWMFDTFTKVNNGLWLQLEKGQLTFNELKKIRFSKVFEALNIEFDGPTFEAYFRKELDQSAIPVDGAYEMLESLKDKAILATASNGPTGQQMHRLALAKMDRYFTYFFISESLGVSKPAKEFFELSFQEINKGRQDKILPKDCVIIGDSLTSDIAGGKNAGMKTCLFRFNKNLKPNENVDYVIDDLREAGKVLFGE